MLDTSAAAQNPSAAAALLRAWISGLTLPPNVTIDQWADKYRYIADGLSPKPGKWNTDFMPHTREIMQALSPSHPCSYVTYMGSSQTSGKTEVGVNFMCASPMIAPGSMMIGAPSFKMVKEHVKRFELSIAGTPELKELFKPRSRKDADSQHMKQFPGGIIYFGSAESSTDVAGKSTRYVYCLEVDRFPTNVDGEGNALELFDTRATMYEEMGIAKRYRESSPGIESLSIISKEFLKGDQSYRYVPCPHCGAMQRLLWPRIEWPEGKPLQAFYRCIHCENEIHEHSKNDILANGAAQWRPTFPERSNHHRSFQISALYCPRGIGIGWGKLAVEFLEKCKDKNSLKVFINTRLGETFKDDGEKIEWERVKERAQPYRLRTVPKHILVVTGGVDVQKNRFEVVISGFDRRQRETVLDHRILPANPENPEDWAILEEYLCRPLVSETGTSLRPECVCIDAGYLGHMVVSFCNANRQRRWYATRGSGSSTRPLIGRPQKWKARADGKVDTFGGDFYLLGEKNAKDWLYGHLQRDGKLNELGEYVRKPDERFFTSSTELEDEFYKQLCSEVWDPHKQRYVKLPGQDRNEVLDCVCLCYVAAMHPIVKMDRFTDDDWTKREALHHGLAPVGKTPDLFAIAPANAEAEKQQIADQFAAAFASIEVTHNDKY